MRVLLLLCVALLAALAASYGVRYGLMEDDRWVGLCAGEAQALACQARHGLGLLVYHGVLAWTSIISALLAVLLPGRSGVVLALLAAVLGIAALVLYTASVGAMALVLGLLRLARLLPQRL
jgi:hypothetical protein